MARQLPKSSSMRLIGVSGRRTAVARLDTCSHSNRSVVCPSPHSVGRLVRVLGHLLSTESRVKACHKAALPQGETAEYTSGVWALILLIICELLNISF